LKVKIAVEKVQLSTLTTVYPIFFPTYPFSKIPCKRKHICHFRASPALKVKIAVEKVQLSTLTTVYHIFSPTVHSLLLFLNIIF